VLLNSLKPMFELPQFADGFPVFREARLRSQSRLDFIRELQQFSMFFSQIGNASAQGHGELLSPANPGRKVRQPGSTRASRPPLVEA